MDLCSLDICKAANAGAALHLRHPTSNVPLVDDQGVAITITLRGRDSDAFRNRDNELTDSLLRGKAKTAADRYADNTDLIGRCTVAWAGIVLDGEALECNLTNAVKLYTRLPWTREQADAFIADRAKYIPVA